MSAKIKKGDILHVQWLDSVSTSAWYNVEEAAELAADTEAMTAQTVGFFFGATEDSLTLSMSDSMKWRQPGMLLRIPRGAILSIRRIE